MFAEPHQPYQSILVGTGYCVACGTPRNPQELSNCPACGEVDWDPYTVTPTITAEDRRFDLPPPWDGTRCEWGRMFGIRGKKGIGKSTLMAQLCRVGFSHPDHPQWGGGAWWITCEESANQVKPRNDRIMRAWTHMPDWARITVHHIDPHKPFVGMNAFWKKVAGNPPRVVILDSASGLGDHEGMQICEQLKAWAQVNQAIVGVIVQLNARGEAFGQEALGHLVDAWGYIGQGRGWLRTLGLEKNRFGDLFNRHWRFGEGGTIVIPDFSDRLLTVIGDPGNYELLPYPLTDNSGKLHQVWDYLRDVELGRGDLKSEVGVLPDYLGYASAGIYAPFKRGRFEIPDDWPDRAKYAQLHGVPWLNPEDLPPMKGLRQRAREIWEKRRREEGLDEPEETP